MVLWVSWHAEMGWDLGWWCRGVSAQGSCWQAVKWGGELGLFSSKMAKRLTSPKSAHCKASLALALAEAMFNADPLISLSPFLCFVQLLASAQDGNRRLLDSADSSPVPTWTAAALLQEKGPMQRWRTRLMCLCVTEQEHSPTCCRLAQTWCWRL